MASHNMAGYKKYKQYMPIMIAFLVGLLAGGTSLAIGATAEVIYACVNNSSGTIHIVAPGVGCASNEIGLNWNNIGPAGPRDRKGIPDHKARKGRLRLGGLVTMLDHARLGDVDFRFHALANFNFSWSDLTGARLSGSDLSGANLTYTILQGAHLDYTNLSNADLSNADLTGADLTGATLKGSKFIGATVGLRYQQTGGVLYAANVNGSDFTNATVDPFDLDVLSRGCNVTLPDGTTTPSYPGC